MALANIACILAESQTMAGGNGVLMIDWDLEAPGLHRYFRNKLTTSSFGMERFDRGNSHDLKPGLIDLFYELDKKTDSYSANSSDAQSSQPLTGEDLARKAISEVNLKEYILDTTTKGLCLLKAGRFNPKDPNEYSERVNKFNWEGLYQKSPQLIRLLAETLAQKYAYVLIDSRTGITDISGICTMLLPEKLVVVFTPNLQSLTGGLDLIRRATDYRKESADLRPLLVFPLVSRVEANEPELRHDWRFGNLDTDGYQPEFEKVLAEVYGRAEVKLDRYFDEMQIQHIPRYAYGEEIAVLKEKIVDKFSLRRSYETFANKLIDDRVPWEGEITHQGAGPESAAGLSKLVSSLLDSLTRSKRSVLMAAVVSMLAITFSTSVFSYYQFQKSEKLRASLETSLKQEHQTSAGLSEQLALSEQRVQELQKPIKQILEDNQKTIDVLGKQVSDVSKERDTAVQNAQIQQNKAAQAQVQADRAAYTVALSEKQMQAALDAKRQAEMAQRDAEIAQKDVLNKYLASQAQVKKLQAQLSK
jgi:hypothetical protein